MHPGKIVVTGAAGLVGQNLVPRLKVQGWQNSLAIDKHPTNCDVLRDRGRRRHQADGFLQRPLADASPALGDWLFLKYNVHWHAESLAHMIGVASPAPFSYFGHEHFSFRG